MKAFPSITVLTVVFFSLGSTLAWGADDESCKKFETAWDDAKKATQAHIKANKGDPKPRDEELQTLRNEESKALARYDECRKDKKDQCDKWATELKTLKDKFGVGTHVSALLCTESDEDTETGLGFSMITALTGQMPGGKKGCDFGSAKTTNKDKITEIEKDIDKLEEKIRKSDNDVIKREKNSQQELDSINEERKKLKEEYENAQESAESEQVKAMQNLRNNQLQLADNIRKIKSAAITARQNVQSAEAELKSALTNAKVPGDDKTSINLRSEAEIVYYCKFKAKQMIGKGSSKTSSQGSERVTMYTEKVNKCVENLHDHRNNLSQSYTNALENRLKMQEDLNHQLDDAEKQYSTLTEDYNKGLQMLQSKMSKALQRYIEKDSELANKYNQAVQRAGQERNQLAMEKMEDQRKIITKYNTQGNLSNSDADEVIATAQEIKALDGKMKICPGHTASSFDDKITHAKQKAEDRSNR